MKDRLGQRPSSGSSPRALDQATRLIVRADDMGMTHSCNTAVKRCFEHGILTCAAIQAPAPWAAEAAAMARKHPAWCIGAHLTPMGEWIGYRWRPVLPYQQVSSLVDADGFLRQTVQDFYARQVDYDQLYREFTAQVSLLQRWGVTLGYVDCHYVDGSNPPDPSYAQVLRSVADHFRLPISEQSGETQVKNAFFVQPEQKEEVLLGRLADLGPGLWLLVCHLLDDYPESQALAYANPADFPDGGVSRHRAAEAGVLLGERARALVEQQGIPMVSYRDIVSGA